MSKPAIATPTSPYVGRMTLLAAGVGLAGAAIVIAATPPAVASLPAPAIEQMPLVEETAPAVIESVVREVAPPQKPTDAARVTFKIGSTLYMHLADVRPYQPDAEDAEGEDVGDVGDEDEGEVDRREPAVKHGAFRFSHKGDYHGAIVATAKASDVPPEHRTWLGKRVVVDGACTTTVTGFAVVSEVVGDPGYASEEGNRWTRAMVQSSGDEMLVATLGGCHGSFARDAALSPAVVLTEEKLFSVDPTGVIMGRARELVIASAVGRGLHDAWAEAGASSDWYEDGEVGFTNRFLRHPVTGERFLSVHAKTEFSCGGLEANAWWLFRVGPNGELTSVQERGIEGISKIDMHVDLDGNGIPEILGPSWLGLGVQIQATDGRVIDDREVDYYGCPC